ncbi:MULTISPECIES: cation:proton antiporter [Acinetobacter]|jgi:CPA1 family monovalent cation:H+ antiporter|uniref:cation:proton antiporter n=1 Tax=Acinetobacter TaxID=469 RepID=UPI000277C2A5|nr:MULTISPECIES: sodium:proton antiporter [Acinetobacter]EJO34562.1 transporter, CPA2 family [Acinetobacter radioresistens WC-A-157]EXF56565.1 sodium/hydrogen exchanger family protein [Acinetobacter sp. 1294596]KCX37852.1 sodium/hydrogen exchanger family protein [Acinetobacter sp. 263903-1]MCK4080626.1 sodium:proton antiporter [Acinetobacter radioresistens]MCK4091119.1 sodium:proton antiporter [Acinetobacter radioresistens]
MGNFFLLQALTVIFALSIATTIFNKRILDFPQAIGVPIVSAVFVFILQWGASLLNGNQFIVINIHNIEEAVRGIDFYDFLINGVICFILTSSALKFKISDLRSHWKPIGILATIALVICAVFFGGILYGFQALIGNPVPILVLLLLGSALGATDPIGVKGVLSSVRAPHHLIVKLEGESLFNDAMCIAVFMTLLNVLQGEHFTLLGTLENFLYEIVVAVIIGWGFGLGILRLLRGKHEMESLILTTALLACGSYLVALFAHASAPIACVIGGLIVGNKWKEILHDREIREVNHFWHTVEGIINSFLFTLIGLELFILDLSSSMILGGIFAFFALHISRFAANFLSFAFFPSFRKKSYNGSLTILSWGGVRGGISLALILAVANIPQLREYSSILIGYTFISVLLSGVVCGLGLPAVMNAFYYNPNEETQGFKGWYQRLCHKMNRKGFKYIVGEDANGNETITVYQPEEIMDQKTDDGITAVHHPIKAQEVKRLESPDNF